MWLHEAWATAVDGYSTLLTVRPETTFIVLHLSVCLSVQRVLLGETAFISFMVKYENEMSEAHDVDTTHIPLYVWLKWEINIDQLKTVSSMCSPYLNLLIEQEF